ncbi:MAG TPA: hypothetical protein VHU87_01660 [Rhizomicrobium sp.]|jgi:hypothetical protein|nr:hypothetical protein [Rhizomicrobium sp.]
MKLGDRMLGISLLIGAAVTAFYWWSYFTGGDVMVLHERWYTAFESSFPVADGWMGLCMAAAGAGLMMGRAFGPRFGLMAGAAILYLSAMDVTFDVENGMYAMAAANGAMKFEMFINAACVLLGVWILLVSWRRLDAYCNVPAV